MRAATTRLDLTVARTVTPGRLTVGTPGRVELEVRNGRGAHTGVLRLHDAVSGTAGASMLVDPLPPGGTGEASYRLPTQRRGTLRIGPLRIDVVDPFGLATASLTGAPAVDVTVYPHVDDVAAPPRGPARGALSARQLPNAARSASEDFYALRPYEVGDDLRRVHWRSSARHDELLVRQADERWQARTTVVLDVRVASYEGDSFERAVSAAASVLTAAARRDDLVRLITTDGTDSGFGPGTSQLDRLMEHLALVDVTARARLSAALTRLSARPAAGSLVSVVGLVPSGDLAALVGLRAREPEAVVVRFEGARSAAVPANATAVEGRGVAVCPDGSPFPVAWSKHLGARVRARL